MYSFDSVSYLKYMRDMRRVFHADPEPSFGEYETQKRILAELDRLSIPYRTLLTGVVADVAGTEGGKTLAFRADMDALCLTEENDVDYRSKNAGVMHACGHDGHMACLLGLARYLTERPPRRNVRLIFQPGEEGEGGAIGMIDGGCLDGADEIYALHVDPCLPRGSVGVGAGAEMAGTVEFDVAFTGKSAHAAEKKQGIDALAAAHRFLTGFYRLAEELDESRLLLHCGKLSSGSARNVVANLAVCECTFRYFDAADRDRVMRRLRELVAETDETFATNGRLVVEAEYIPVVNAQENVARIANAAKRLGLTVVPETPRFTAEDFAFYADKIPGALFWLGVGSGENAKLHTPRFDFNEEALLFGLALFIELLEQ